MMYPIPAAWTTDGFSAGFNRELSGTDKEFIRDAYPWGPDRWLSGRVGWLCARRR